MIVSVRAELIRLALIDELVKSTPPWRRIDDKALRKLVSNDSIRDGGACQTI